MKKKFTFLFFLLMIKLIMPSKAQAPSWQWAKSAGDIYRDYGTSVDSDNSGNIYATGDFEPLSISFDSITLLSTDNGNNRDVFIVKYNSAGVAQWAISGYGPNSCEDYSTSIATDGNGNSYIVGRFNCVSITFDNHTLSNSGASFDFFLVKVDPSGNVIWIRNGIGSNYGDDGAENVSIDNAGNVYVSGYFESTTLTCGSYTVINSGFNADMFVAKYDSSGNALWVRSGGGLYSEYTGGICIDSYNNAWVGGRLQSPTATFGSNTFTNNINTGYSSDLFLTKYNSSGALLWARAFGGNNNDYFESLTSDGYGNVFATGWFVSDTLSFDSITLIKNGFSDLFIVKFNSAGNVVWAKRAGGGSSDYGLCVAAESNGNVYLSGDFGSHKIIFGNDTLINNNTQWFDLFNVKYDSLGNCIWAKHTYGTKSEYPIGSNIDIYGNLIVTGGYNSTAVQFDNTTITATSFSDDNQFFLAKIGNFTAIPEYEDKKSIRIFPNPSDGRIQVLCSEKIDELSITNIYGQEICRIIKPKSNFYHSINENGIYFVTAIIKGDKATRKIVVCR